MISKGLHRAQAFELQGETSRAERAYRTVLEKEPRNAAALKHLAQLLCGRGAFEKAVPLLRRAAAVEPREATCQMNLAAALLRIGDDLGAIDAYARAVEIDPRFCDARLNLAYRLRALGRLADARGHYERLLRDEASDRLARWNLAALSALEGDLDAAFAAFAHPQCMRSAALPANIPRWGGEPLAGKRILLEAEQGLGDAIMFARLAPLVSDAGGSVVLRADPSLEGLLKGCAGIDAFANRNEPAPAADVWAPLAELPAIFGAQNSFLAGRTPYIAATSQRRELWKSRLPETPLRRIGLTWAGGQTHPEDRLRSVPLSILMSELADVPGIEWVSLQKGPPATEAEATGLVRSDRDIGDFEDTAAVLTRLDLLITVDTSVLHLAGAMGRPVWGLLAFLPDWRWMLERSDSPWYPTLRLFRQREPGDWASVARAVADALRA